MSYQEIAVNASKRLQVEKISPIIAWKNELNGTTDKVCPKNTFLGLCQNGLIKNVPQGNYTRSTKNLSYAIEGVRLLKLYPNRFRNGNELWNEIYKSLNLTITHNEQGNVIFEIWKNDLLNLDL